MAPICFKVNTEYAQLSEIIPGLFICGVSSLTPSNVKAFKFQLIVNVTKEVPNFKALGEIQRIKLWVDDVTDEDLFPHFDLISDQIHAIIQDGGKVLVHCVAGVSRSASVCLAYLLKYYCRSLRDSYHLMCSKRPMVRPNLGFWRQLIHYEQIIKKNAGSVRLVRDEAQPDKILPDVYFKNVIPPRPVSPELSGKRIEGVEGMSTIVSENDSSQEPTRRSRNSNASGGSGRIKFQPTLEHIGEVAEIGEAAA